MLCIIKLPMPAKMINTVREKTYFIICDQQQLIKFDRITHQPINKRNIFNKPVILDIEYKNIYSRCNQSLKNLNDIFNLFIDLETIKIFKNLHFKKVQSFTLYPECALPYLSHHSLRGSVFNAGRRELLRSNPFAPVGRPDRQEFSLVFFQPCINTGQCPLERPQGGHSPSGVYPLCRYRPS